MILRGVLWYFRHPAPHTTPTKAGSHTRCNCPIFSAREANIGGSKTIACWCFFCVLSLGSGAVSLSRGHPCRRP